MADPRVRQAIAVRAAAIMYAQEESEYLTAKRKAAKQMRIDWKHSPKDLPSNSEIRDQIHLLADMLEGDRRGQNLREMRLIALAYARLLEPFRPRLIGSTLTGHIRSGSDIDLHVFSDNLAAVTNVLDDHGVAYETEHKPIRKHGQTTVYTHLHIQDRFPVELTLYTREQHRVVFRSSITGKPIERANLQELENLMSSWYPDIDCDVSIANTTQLVEDYDLFRMLLRQLESVKQNPRYHPEGDALYHSLQVFELARQERSYDIDFCLAALLHDVGKSIDPANHVAAGVEALQGSVSPRTLVLIEHHMHAHAYRDGSLGARARRRLNALDDLEDLLLLSQLDQAGRQRGVAVCSVDDALGWLEAAANEWL